MGLKKLLICILILLGNLCFAQNKYFGKVETGYLKYLWDTVYIKPGPGWNGYNLDKQQKVLI
jgi:hypothetical protein